MNRELWFPTPIWFDHLEISNLNEIEQYCLQKEKTEPTDCYSNVNGWQKEFDLNDVVFLELQSKIDEKIEEIAEEYNIKSSISVKRQLSWMNVNRKGSYNHVHIHPRKFLSAVFYVTAPENCGEIVFEDSRLQRSSHEPSNWFSEMNPLTFHSTGYIPEVGKLVVFPSWVKHYVTQSLSDEPRISLAFDYKVFYESD